MAKIKNMIKKNMMENNVKALQEEMKQKVEAGDFVAAMDVMAELVGCNGINVDIMYLGAYCYMMTDDNERAARWVTNILNVDSSHVQARILLGRICIMEDRTEDALTIFDYILENMKDKLSIDDEQTLKDLLDYYRFAEADMIKDNYPNIAEFLGLVENDVEKSEDEAAARARNAVAKLRELLNNKKQEKEKQTTPIVCETTKVKDNAVVPKATPEMKTEVAESELNVDVISQQIMSSPVSMKEKIKLFNAFAAGCYVNGDYQAAFDLLSGALVLDSADTMVLRNIAYVCAAAGEVDQAMEFASKLPMIDFALLKGIK